MAISTFDNKIKKEVTDVLWRIVLFIIYYLVLILLGLGLFVAAFGLTWFILQYLSDISDINVSAVFWIFILWLAMWWFCIQIAWHLIKPLFTFHFTSNENRFEVKREECLELFAIIENVARATGNKMPKHVYLTAEVNACVFYNSTSVWAIFLPTRKNLEVGLGLLQGMNKEEVKAILGHEFGHFSQGTMKIGSITYRLLLIIRDMIKQAQEQQRSAALSCTSDSDWVKFFHLASVPISFITSRTIDFYNLIEKKNRSLSRYMEFEADAVACRVVGVKPFISSLCKLAVLSDRYNLYENMIAYLLGEKKTLKDFWNGYEYVDELLAKDEQLKVSFKDILTCEIGDKSKCKSKVTIINGWNTHPSTEERIKAAKQNLDDKKSVEPTDSRTIVPSKSANAVGTMYQRFIAENMNEPIKWNEVKEISISDFKEWAKDWLSAHHIPHFLLPFTSKNVVSFAIPSEEEMQTSVESPFTEQNRQMLLEFCQGVVDWNILNDFNSKKSGSMQLLYEGKSISSSTKAIELHKAYMDSFNERVLTLDLQIYKYLWHRAKDKSSLKIIYRAMFIGNDGLRSIADLREMIDVIRRQANFYLSNGLTYSLRDDVREQLTKDFYTFMRSFDFKDISSIIGNLKNGNKETLNDMLQKAYVFASNEDVPNIAISSLFEIFDEVYLLLDYLYNLGKSQWTEKVINAYKGIQEREEPESSRV